MGQNFRFRQSSVEILSGAQTNRFVLQDFTPLAESLEWTLGQRYLSERGVRAFLSDSIPVPYAINNNGVMSARAADLLFTSLTSAESKGVLGRNLLLLEFGVGLGLFARFFLDSFRELCVRHRKDYYDRLTYVLADHSERMLLDVVRRGVLAGHPGRYLLCVADAFAPQVSLATGIPLPPETELSFHGVFLNYVLDCLPPAILRADGEGIEQLCVRLCLSRGVTLQEYTHLSPEELAGMASSPSPDARNQLLELFGLFSSEYQYTPVDSACLPHGEFAAQYARAHKGAVMYNYGAMQSLDQLLSLLAGTGFILVNDYGYVGDVSTDELGHQRFSHTTAVGLNFAMLKAYFGESGRCDWIEPAEDGSHIFSRLLGRQIAPEVASCFREHFAKAAWDRLDEPVQRAKQLASQMRYEAAATEYRIALERQPSNWQLLCEVSNFLNYSLRDPQAGLEMARCGLALNPSCSAELWNACGDCLFSLGRIAEAATAFEQALRVNPDDVMARYNLAWVYLHRKDHRQSLRLIAEALALDWRGEYRQRLLQKQSEVLADLARRSRQEYQTLIDRVSQHPASPGRETDRLKDEPQPIP